MFRTLMGEERIAIASIDRRRVIGGTPGFDITWSQRELEMILHQHAVWNTVR